MATTTDFRAAGVQPKFLPTGAIHVIRTIAIASAPTINDVWQVVDLPPGAIVTGVTLDSDRLDTNGSPTLTLDVGDASAAQRFIAASTNAQTATTAPQTINVKGVLGYTYAARTTIQVLVHAVAATFAAGSVRLKVSYTMDA